MCCYFICVCVCVCVCVWSSCKWDGKEEDPQEASKATTGSPSGPILRFPSATCAAWVWALRSQIPSLIQGWSFVGRVCPMERTALGKGNWDFWQAHDFLAQLKIATDFHSFQRVSRTHGWFITQSRLKETSGDHGILFPFFWGRKLFTLLNAKMGNQKQGLYVNIFIRGEKTLVQP